MNKQELTLKHSFTKDSIFRLKTSALIIYRHFQNFINPTKKFKSSEHLINRPVIGYSESELWNPNDNKDNWVLTAGKIENLRISSKKLHGLEIKANEVFSFWKHIGNPNFGKGYVIGREIREGCIVPTIAGGLCQLSNALYDAALKANFDIIERHKHSQVIKGSLAEQDRDATVKWNYIDLRFKSTFDFRIEVELNSDKLIVQFKSEQRNLKSNNENLNQRAFHKLNDCYSCGNHACFKHPDRSSLQIDMASTTFILDEYWPEYDSYIKEIATADDHFILPLKRNIFMKSDRYSWKSAIPKKTKATYLQGIYRALKFRTASKKRNNVFELSLNLDKKIAVAAAKLIPIESTHIVISQNLLPFLFESGALGGRSYDVLMTRLPFEALHHRLDYAYALHPESKTLNDFRANKELVDIEKIALKKARHIITPHAEIADLFEHKVLKLKRDYPSTSNQKRLGSKVLFPASAVGRKGAYEVKRVAQELSLNLVIGGRKMEYGNFWENMNVGNYQGNINEIALLIYPTFIENQPRQILKAISRGIPVITTKACGIEASNIVSIIEFNEIEQLKNEIKKHQLNSPQEKSSDEIV